MALPGLSQGARDWPCLPRRLTVKPRIGLKHLGLVEVKAEPYDSNLRHHLFILAFEAALWNDGPYDARRNWPRRQYRPIY